MSSDDLVQRMNDLETRLAFQDDTIQALNDVVSKQELELERLQRAVELLARRQADLAAALQATTWSRPPAWSTTAALRAGTAISLSRRRMWMLQIGRAHV